MTKTSEAASSGRAETTPSCPAPAGIGEKRKNRRGTGQRLMFGGLVLLLFVAFTVLTKGMGSDTLTAGVTNSRTKLPVVSSIASSGRQNRSALPVSVCFSHSRSQRRSCGDGTSSPALRSSRRWGS